MTDIPKYIVDQYENKKASCIPRAISFDFTLEEYYRFCKLKESVNCFYSNKQFEYDAPKKGQLWDNRPTIERLDDSKGYSLSNCVWCTQSCNMLKNNYFQLGHNIEDADLAYRSVIARIGKLLSNTEALREAQKPYLSLGDTLHQENMKAAQAHRELQEKLEEVYLAEMYSKFGKQLLIDLKVNMELTFSEFKRTITRKKCEVTKRPLPEDVRERALWIKDKTAKVDLSNLICTTVVMSEALDTFSVKADLSHDMMCQLFKKIEEK